MYKQERRARVSIPSMKPVVQTPLRCTGHLQLMDTLVYLIEQQYNYEGVSFEIKCTHTITEGHAGN